MGTRNQDRYAGNLGGNVENSENQFDGAGNQGGNLATAVKMTQNNSENDKLKEWRKVKIIENEHLCKNLFSHI